MPHAMSHSGSFESSLLASAELATQLQSQSSVESADIKDKSLKIAENSSTSLATAPMSPPIPSPEISQKQEPSILIMSNQENIETESKQDLNSSMEDSEILPDAHLVTTDATMSFNSQSLALENDGTETTTITADDYASPSTIDNSIALKNGVIPQAESLKDTATVITEDSTPNETKDNQEANKMELETENSSNIAEAKPDTEPTTSSVSKSEDGATAPASESAPVVAPTPIVIKPELAPDSQLLNPEMNPPESSPRGFAKHQLKFALAAIRSLKRLKDAGPFLHPVDAVKLNIPTYYDVIQNPMDISTMEKKLNAGEYETVMEFGIDMEYIVANCVAFNGPDSFISNMVKSIKASFDKHMQNMPLYELVTAASRKKKASTPVVANGNTSGAQKSVPVAENSGLEIKSETGRPRREIHPPKPKDMPYSDMRPRNKRYAAELRFCSQVLKELYSKKHKSISFAFLQPVDPVALDCPTYFDIVKKPMDLGTVTQKLNNNQYENGDEFRDDIKQIFENCYAFNPKGSPVNIMGHQLESVFDKKWEEKPIYQPTPPPASSHGDDSDTDQSESGQSDEDSEEDESDDEETVAATTNPAIAFLEQQLERMKQDLLKMKKEAAKEARKAAKALAKKRKSKKSSEKRKTTKRRRRSSATKNEPMTISYEMQQELARKIYTLDEQKTAHVINIIHQSMPELSNNGQGEIELDMDLLDRNTLEKLYKFVVLEGKKLSINSSSFNMNGSKPSSKAKTTKKRSKSLTEAEQAKQIEDIQKKIKQFDHNGNENIAESSNEESSDDDSDESSSEEE